MPSGRMKSVEAHRFAMQPRADIPRSSFDMKHIHKTTFTSGLLVPVYVQEVLPGDSIRCRMHAFARLAPAIVPVMDNLILESFFFFVPNRLVWQNWQRFMGEQNEPSDTTVFLLPGVEVTAPVAAQTGTVFDYFGITMNNVGSGSVTVNALPFRAYNLIWNEWFRDEDLQFKAVVHTDNGPDPEGSYVMRHRGKRHDYFTSARPWPEKPINAQQTTSSMDPQFPGSRFLLTPDSSGFGQVGAPVSGIGFHPGAGYVVDQSVRDSMRFAEVVYKNAVVTNNVNNVRIRAREADNAPDVRVLINDLRMANSIQRMLELNARGGTRYTELVRAHFGVISPDARLQRPEYLGGGRSFVNVQAHAQSSATGIEGGDTVLGEQSGIGTLQVYDHGFSQSFTEHGHIIGMIQVRADLSYQQGIRRMWFRRTQFDFYWPSLAHLGEQAIQSRELYSEGTAGDTDVFGYQERWSEYRSMYSRVSGQFRSSRVAPLDMWHFSQQFSDRPVLNDAFVRDEPPVPRVLQVALWGQEFLMDALFEERVVRAMPMFSVPGLGPRL